MKIGFVNFAPLVYDVATPLKQPLGGSESSICYLSVELARRGHQVILYGRYAQDFEIDGVTHRPQEELFELDKEGLDFLVNQSYTFFLEDLKRRAGKKTRLILWEQLSHNQPATATLHLPKTRDAVDAYVFVSQWQMDSFIKKFGINPHLSFILKNCISPAFENIFFQDKSILKYKKPTLAYTSAPFRGLEPLLMMFPEIKKKVPQATLKVFSSMDVYQKKGQEKKDYQYLYDLCKKTKGVEYHGSVSQTKLARELKSVLLLTYPAVWIETSCIAVMEAMAAGCKVVTTHLAALPETTAGFGFLIPDNNKRAKNRAKFIDFVVNTLTKLLSGDIKTLEKELKEQVSFCEKNYTWKRRSAEWESLLLDLRR